MTTQADPGSYTVADDPWDDFQATMVPLRTPLGPVTLHFLHAGEVFMVSGYETGEYRGGQAYGNTTEEAFTWKGAEIIGSQNFRREGDTWLPLTSRNFPGHGYGSLHFSARHGRNVTAKMAADIAAYWAKIIRRYAAEHPFIPAHAEARRANKALNDQDQAIAETEKKLAAMREAQRVLRVQLRAAYLAEHTTSEPDVTCWPLPYHREILNPYITELDDDLNLNSAITAARQLANREASS